MSETLTFYTGHRGAHSLSVTTRCGLAASIAPCATAVSNAVKTHIKSTGQHVGTVDVGEEDGDGNPVLHQCHHLEDGMFHPGQLNFSGLKYNYAVCCDMGICSPFSSPFSLSLTHAA